MSNECKHGSLRRSCEICERDVEIERLRAELAEKDKRIAELEAAVRQAIVWFERPEPFEDGETYPLWQDAADYLRKHGLKEENWKVSDD